MNGTPIAAFALAGTVLIMNGVTRLISLIFTRPLFILRLAFKSALIFGSIGLLLLFLVVGLDNSNGCKSPEQIWAKGRAETEAAPAKSCADWGINNGACRAAVRGFINTMLGGTVGVTYPVCWVAKAITPPNRSKRA